MRDRWLNPPELVNLVPEVISGFPNRVVPKDVAAEAILRKRTLTNLYNMRARQRVPGLITSIAHSMKL